MAERAERERNPASMDNAVWAWLIRSGFGSYAVNQYFGGSPSTDAGPCWSWEHFGPNATQLPDGRTVLVAGEHEDTPSFDEPILVWLYEPALPHEALPEREDEHDVRRIRVDGVVLRYVEVLIEDLRDKLARLEKTPYGAIRRAP